MKPFLKWAGGKRWFVNKYSDLIPDTFDHYIEPFVGGGAMFFALAPQKAILSDYNSKLISTYEQIRDDWRPVWDLLVKYQRCHSKEFYYATRAREPVDRVELAARFIYLNRTCWNGLYRENRKGIFNVPIGTKNTVIFEDDDFSEWSRLLQNARLIPSDFLEVIDSASSGDFIFADPPYTVKHNLNGFLKYNERVFSWSDQVRLKDSLLSAANRGAKIVLTNGNHASIRDLYKDSGVLVTVDRHSILAGKPSARTGTSEAVFLLGPC